MQSSIRSLTLCGIAGIGAVAALTWGPALDGGEARATQSATGGSLPKFNDARELMRPVDYRRWVFVGSPVTPNELNNGKAAFPEFHNVYINPEAYDHYIQTGKWMDGTMLVKEMVSVGAKQSTSGSGYFQGDFQGVEVEVKDSKRFPDEPGNWAFFGFTAEAGKPPVKQAKHYPTAACATCHQTSAKDDLVFTQHYPVLRAAKSAGRNPENLP